MLPTASIFFPSGLSAKPVLLPSAPRNQQHNHRDIIPGFASGSQIDQGLRGRLKFQPAHRPCDFGVIHHIGQAVCTEQQQVAGAQAQSWLERDWVSVSVEASRKRISAWGVLVEPR